MKFDKILVDADILLYKIGFATQHNVYHVYFEGCSDPRVYTDKRKLNKLLEGLDYELHVYTFTKPLLSAKLTIDKIIETYKEKFQTKDIQLYLTGSDNFREKVATILPYKGNRATTDKPHHYDAIKDYLIKRHKAQVINGQEADDELSIRSTDKSVIVTIDKDLDMVVGWHYNPDKDKLYHVDKLEGMRWFYKQLLMGDSVDNIPGIKGIGKVTAEKLLQDAMTYQEMEAIVLDKYKNVYLCPREAMTEVGRLLWMRTKYNEMWEMVI